ncbi:hypothetical protein SELMODRAFT_417332 [Selaginella moellendorffii]|uniref:Protein kinase domain-containing protein n=1 Tax=Selaginella moellendorffii TaxID=88036 RepID=D8S1W3_SELML|nr:hypothetical protein SELMODRAFT_417332 [Selaginella moellendorffii]
MASESARQEQGVSGISDEDSLWVWTPEPVIHLNQLHGILVPRCSPAYAHPPPLDIMCPIDSFVVVDWPGFETGFQEWWASHHTNPAKGVKDVQVFKQKLLDTSSKYTKVVLKVAAYPFLGMGETFSDCLVGHPELSINDSSITFNGVAYSSLGVLLVGVTGNDSMLLRAHITSREHAQMLLKLGYLIKLARNNGSPPLEAQQARTLWKPVCGGGVSRLNVLQHRFMELAKEMGVAKLRDMATKFEFLDMGSLQGMVTLHSSSCVVRAAWKGKPVVLKLRDLTLSDRWKEELSKTIWEANMYMRLRKLQGRCIPVLYSLGFFHGGMFSFLMMSDARVGDVPLPDPTCPPEAAIAAAQGCREAVSGMHNRGILHGDLVFTNVAVSRRPSGGYAGMLVGFSQARLVGPGEQRHLLSKEWLHLESMLKVLLPKAEEDVVVYYK